MKGTTTYSLNLKLTVIKKISVLGVVLATVEHCTDTSGKVLMDGNVLRWTDGDQLVGFGIQRN